MSVFLASIGFGLITAAVLAIAAVGFTLQFAVTNVLNLAYGAVMIVSAYVAYAVNQPGVKIWVARSSRRSPPARSSRVSSTTSSTALPAPRHRRRSRSSSSSLGMTLIIEFGTAGVGGADERLLPMSQGATLGAGSFQLTVARSRSSASASW